MMPRLIGHGFSGRKEVRRRQAEACPTNARAAVGVARLVVIRENLHRLRGAGFSLRADSSPPSTSDRELCQRRAEALSQAKAQCHLVFPIPGFLQSCGRPIVAAAAFPGGSTRWKAGRRAKLPAPQARQFPRFAEN